MGWTRTIKATMAASKQDTHIVSSGAQTLARGLSVVEFLAAAAEPQRPSDIARALGLDRNAVYRMLLELQSQAYVVKVSERGGYVVGNGLIALAATVMRKVDLRRSALAYMEKVAESTGETVGLHVRNNRTRICIEVVPGRHAVRRVVNVGETLPLWAGPSGKVILAFMEPMEVDLILVEAKEAGQDVEKIRRQLDEIRLNGYIASVGDRSPGVGGLSVPVFKADGIGASLTVSGPASRWTQESMENAAGLVKGMCDSLSESLGFVPS